MICDQNIKHHEKIFENMTVIDKKSDTLTWYSREVNPWSILHLGVPVHMAEQKQ